MARRFVAFGTLRPPFAAALVATVVLSGAVALQRFEGATLPTPPAALVASVLPGAVVALTNEERKDSGLGTLRANALLNQAAQMKADDMAAKSYYAHVSPDGTIPPAWLNRVGYKYAAMGENLVVDRENSEAVVSAWMGSHDHRENILNPQFTEIGIGVAHGHYKGRDTIYVVQMLARPQQAALPPRAVEQPRPVQVRPTPTTPVPTRSAATTSVLVRPPPAPAVRDAIRPVLQSVASTTLAEVPSIVAEVTILPQPPATPPYTSEPVELAAPAATTAPEAPVSRVSLRATFKVLMNEIGSQMRSFFSPIL